MADLDKLIRNIENSIGVPSSQWGVDPHKIVMVCINEYLKTIYSEKIFSTILNGIYSSEPENQRRADAEVDTLSEMIRPF